MPDLKILMDKIYNEKPPGEIPWNYKEPPGLLIELIKSGDIIPCKTLDAGCGTGCYSIYMAQKGFDVTGVDLSSAAIQMAARKAEELQQDNCRFLVQDLTAESGLLKEDSFDFVFEWEVLHHIFPEQRKAYLNNIRSLLKPNGKYLSVHFCEENNAFGGEGKLRKTPLGTTLYFSSLNEMKELYSKYFNIIKLKISEARGKAGQHKVIFGLLINNKKS